MPATAATVNRTLTNYASGFAQDAASALAEFIAPTVPTGVAHGQYKLYSDKNDFQVYDTTRALGGGRKRIEFGATDPYFNCAPQGLEAPIDDHERRLAGDGVLNLQQAKLRTLISAATASHEKKVFDLIKAGKAATGAIGTWSNAANDPVYEIDSQIQAIADEIGRMPNRIVFGLSAWNVFRNHAKVLARQPGAELIGLTASGAAKMMLNPGIEIRVGVISADANKFGAAKSATNIVGGEVFIFFASDAPTQYDPSFAKTFSVEATLVGAVKEYRDESSVSDILAMDWTEHIAVVAAAAGRRITLA
jgi:hypothetical protein